MTKTDDERDDGKASRIFPYAQLGMRLIGVLLFFEGIPAVTGGCTQFYLQYRQYADQGTHLDPYSIAWTLSGLAMILGGFYLAADGRWIMKNVLLPRREP